MQAIAKDDVNKGKEEEPDDINEMPIPSRSFETEMLLWTQAALHEAQIHHRQEYRPDQNMQPVEACRHKEG